MCAERYSNLHPGLHRLLLKVFLTEEAKTNVGKQKTRYTATDDRSSPGTTSTGRKAGFGKNGGNSHEH